MTKCFRTGVWNIALRGRGGARHRRLRGTLAVPWKYNWELSERPDDEALHTTKYAKRKKGFLFLRCCNNDAALLGLTVLAFKMVDWFLCYFWLGSIMFSIQVCSTVKFFIAGTDFIRLDGSENPGAVVVKCLVQGTNSGRLAGPLCTTKLHKMCLLSWTIS